MSERLVNEQAVIDALADYICNIDKVYCTGRLSAEDCKDAAHSVLDELPSAEPHTFRVIDTKTGKEADTYEIALKEEWAKGLCYCDMEGFAIEEDGTLILLDECGRCAYCPQGRFEVKWNE